VQQRGEGNAAGTSGKSGVMADACVGLAGNAGGMAGKPIVMADNAGGMAGKPVGRADNTGGMAGMSGGLAGKPIVLADNTGGMAGMSGGMAGKPVGLAGNAGGMAGKPGVTSDACVGLAGNAAGMRSIRPAVYSCVRPQYLFTIASAGGLRLSSRAIRRATTLTRTTPATRFAQAHAHYSPRYAWLSQAAASAGERAVPAASQLPEDRVSAALRLRKGNGCPLQGSRGKGRKAAEDCANGRAVCDGRRSHHAIDIVYNEGYIGIVSAAR
jgi:hypothetical protein